VISVIKSGELGVLLKQNQFLNLAFQNADYPDEN